MIDEINKKFYIANRLEREKKLIEFLKRGRKELNEISFFKRYKCERDVVIQGLKEDIEGNLTLAELVIIKNAVLRAMNNNLELIDSSYGDGRFHNKECYVVPSAEAFVAFYAYHDFEIGVLSSYNEPYLLKKLKEKREKDLHPGL